MALNGAPRPPLGEPLHAHDFIKFRLFAKENIFAISKDFYDFGCNLKEIARLTGFARTSIRTALIEGGVELREYVRDQSHQEELPRATSKGVAPFGFSYKNQRLITNKNELKVILSIYSMWLNGKSLRSIVIHLHHHKVPTRHGKKWTQQKVKLIIRRHGKRIEKKSKKKQQE